MAGSTGTRCMQFGEELTPKEIRFCEEYVKDFNGSAAIRRGNLSPKKPENARQMANKYLQKQPVRDYITKLMNAMSEKCTTDVNDLMTFWTTMMLDVNESSANRLKASDYIAKVLGVYNIKVDTNVAPTIIMDLQPALNVAPPEPIAIDAPIEMIEPAVELVFEGEYRDDTDESE